MHAALEQFTAGPTPGLIWVVQACVLCKVTFLISSRSHLFPCRLCQTKLCHDVSAGTCRFYCEEALEVVNFKLSPLPQYFIPEPGSISSYKDYIVTLPTQDRCAGSKPCGCKQSNNAVSSPAAVLLLALLAICNCLQTYNCTTVLQKGSLQVALTSFLPCTCCRPEAFGQHRNAEISYLIEDSKALLGGMLSLAPRTGGGSTGGSGAGAAAGGGARQEELVEALANDLLDQVRRTPQQGTRGSARSQCAGVCSRGCGCGQQSHHRTRCSQYAHICASCRRCQLCTAFSCFILGVCSCCCCDRFLLRSTLRL